MVSPLVQSNSRCFAGKEKKKATKTAAQSQTKSTEETGISPDDLRAALAKVRAEEVPATPEEKEQYFMNHVSIGEQLAAKGMRPLNLYSLSSLSN